MNTEELKTKLRERLDYVSRRLEEKFEKIYIHDEESFLLPNGIVIHVTAMGGEYNGLVIEFSENIEEARKYNSDDGELYFMDEYGPEEMFDEMMKEIENEL